MICRESYDFLQNKTVLVLDPSNELIKEYEPVLLERINQLEAGKIDEETDSGNESASSQDDDEDDTDDESSSSENSSSPEEDT